MNWESFFDNLTAGDIVPVIGSELSLVKGDDDTPYPLYEYISRELTRRLEIPYDGQTISELALTYPNDNIPATSHAIYNKLDEDKFFLDPLEKLAELRDFHFYISTSLDDLLLRSLCKTRGLKKSQLNILNYSLQQFTDITTYSEEETEHQATVFNVLGSFADVTESAFNQEEMMEHFLSINSRFNHHPMVDYFLRQVKNKILLFIGCDFPDWFMRFIIRFLTNQRYKFRSFNDYYVPERSGQAAELIRFLKHFHKNVVVDEEMQRGNARAFVKELHEKWMAFHQHRNIQYDGTVFLSYNHRDVEKVSAFKKLLRARGIRNVWFDIDDLPSGEHRSAIEEEIKKCKVFMPMLSEDCLSHPQSYTWQVEWKAIEMRLMADKFYGKPSFQLLPCILDDTKRDDARIPQYMQAFAVWELEENKEKVVQELVKSLTPLQ